MTKDERDKLRKRFSDASTRPNFEIDEAVALLLDDVERLERENESLSAENRRMELRFAEQAGFPWDGFAALTAKIERLEALVQHQNGALETYHASEIVRSVLTGTEVEIANRAGNERVKQLAAENARLRERINDALGHLLLARNAEAPVEYVVKVHAALRDALKDKP